MLENRFELEAASPLQEIDKEVLLYHQDYYEKWEELQEEVVIFIWRLLPSAATSASHVYPPIFITQTNKSSRTTVTGGLMMTTFSSVL